MQEIFTKEQIKAKKQARLYMEKEVSTVADEMDEQAIFPKDLFFRLGKLGFTGIMCPKKYGGSGMDTVAYAGVAEELSRGWLAFGGTYSIQMTVSQLILNNGTEKQKKKYLPRLCTCESIGAIAMTETAAGSDVASISSTAMPCKHGYLLNGSKLFITPGGEADIYIVLFNTGSKRTDKAMFIVEKDTPGFYFGRKERKMGYKSSPTWELIFENCFVPSANIIGKTSNGLHVTLKALECGRIGVGAVAVGLAQAALDQALTHAKQRVQFGKPIADFQGIQFMLADMATSINAARQLVYYSARLRDAGASYNCEAAMAKLFASDTAMKVTTEAVQIFGGYGYMLDCPVQRYMREAKALQIVEGTNQIQRIVIARNILGNMT